MDLMKRAEDLLMEPVYCAVHDGRTYAVKLWNPMKRVWVSQEASGMTQDQARRFADELNGKREYRS